MSKFTDYVGSYTPKLMADFAFTPEDAAAIMGNFAYETGGFEHLQEIKPVVAGSRGGYGWAQWTGQRRVDYESYCRRNELNPADPESNYKYVWVELNGSEKRAVGAVKAASGLEAKTIAFEKSFERAGVKNYASRYSWAKKALTAYSGPAAPQPEEPSSSIAVPASIAGLIAAIVAAVAKYYGLI